MRLKFIDSDEDHIKVLAELNQLDDVDNWELFKKQENALEKDIDLDTWFKYVRVF